MADDDLIRDHDPFSGHEAPAPAADSSEPPKAAEEQPPPPAAAKKPARGRRPRRTPSASEVEGTRRRARR